MQTSWSTDPSRGSDSQCKNAPEEAQPPRATESKIQPQIFKVKQFVNGESANQSRKYWGMQTEIPQHQHPSDRDLSIARIVIDIAWAIYATL